MRLGRRIVYPNRRMRIDNFGGAIYATQGCNLEFVDCRFTYNDANTAVEPNAVMGPDSRNEWNDGDDRAVQYLRQLRRCDRGGGRSAR